MEAFRGFVAVLPRPKTGITVVAIFARPACHRLGLVKVGLYRIGASGAKVFLFSGQDGPARGKQTSLEGQRPMGVG
jgi:hypothetical protein